MDDKVFHQSTSVFFLNSNEEVQPQTDTNLVEFTDGTPYVPKTMWKFETPGDPSTNHVAAFRDADVSNELQGGVDALRVTGVMMSESPGKEAVMLMVGHSGKCNGICAILKTV